MRILGSLVRLTMGLAICVPAFAGEQGGLADRLQAMASDNKVDSSTRSPETAWSKAGLDFEGFRDAPSAVAAARPAQSGSTSAGPGRAPTVWKAPALTFKMSAPPVPGSGAVTLQAADDKKDDKKKDEAPPPDPKAVAGAAAGMLIGALIGLLLGGPIGLCIGLCIGALIGAAAGKMMPDKSGGPGASPAPAAMR